VWGTDRQWEGLHCEVLTGSGQILQCEVVTDTIETLQFEVLRHNGQNVMWVALTDS
jgi:hypothetical protein